jgi:hypothetical protein
MLKADRMPMHASDIFLARPQRNKVKFVIATLATAAALSLMTATTQAAAISRQRAQSAADFIMPSGDFQSATDAAEARSLRLTPRLSPTPPAELARIKKMAGAAAEAEAVDAAVASEGTSSKTIFTECVTNAANGFAPSDIHGAVSPTNLAVTTNVTVGVYNKSTCAVVSRVSLKTFFSQNGGFTIPASQTLFDPRVLYDRINGRCIITVDSNDSGNTDQYLYVASSRTSSCTTWRRVRFVLSEISSGTVFCKAAASDFYDYPNAGYNVSRLAVTSNNFPTAGGTYGTLLSIDKAALHGTATVFGLCFRSALPTNMAPGVVGDRVTAMFILSPGSGSGSSINRRRLNPVGSGGTMADTLTNTGNVAVPAWTAAPNAAQPNGQLLDTLDGRFQSASKQIGSVIWNTHAENVGGRARVRTYRISTTGGLLSNRTTTTSTCANVDHTFNPSVDTNATTAGTLVYITYSRTCPSQAGAGNAAHLISRGANTLAGSFTFETVETSAAQFTGCGSACRWGDYSATQIDPTDTGRAWGFNQLVTGTSQFNWNTRAAKVGP